MAEQEPANQEIRWLYHSLMEYANFRVGLSRFDRAKELESILVGAHRQVD